MCSGGVVESIPPPGTSEGLTYYNVFCILVFLLLNSVQLELISASESIQSA